VREAFIFGEIPKSKNNVNPFAYQFFWRTRRYKSIYNLIIDKIEMLIHHSKNAFFSALKRYMTCHAIYWQQARTKSKDIGGSDRLTAGCVCNGIALPFYLHIHDASPELTSMKFNARKVHNLQMCWVETAWLRTENKNQGYNVKQIKGRCNSTDGV
jgi:hypothetical protein